MVAPVRRYAFYARGAVASIAMLDYPYPASFVAPLPANPVQRACSLLASAAPSNAVSALAALHRVVLSYVNATEDLPCVDLRAELVGSGGGLGGGGAVGASDLGSTAWNYQACTELLLEPITSDGCT